jgi:hypothetical protein
MSTVLTQTYCAFCEVVANAFEKTVGITESVGRARAASALAQMGYYEEAKQLMLDK